MNEALRDWVTNVARHLLLHRHGRRARIRIRPWCATSSRVIGSEAREQMHGARKAACPTAVVACVGGGSNAIGLFHPFLDDRHVEIYGVEAAGHGLVRAGMRRPSPADAPACCTATAPTCCMNEDGQIAGRPLDLRRPRLSGHRPRARLAARDGPGEVHLRDRRGGAGSVQALLASSRASCPPSNRRTPSPRWWRSRRRSRRTT